MHSSYHATCRRVSITNRNMLADSLFHFHFQVISPLAKGLRTLLMFCTSSSDSHCTRSSEPTQGPRSFITLPPLITEHRVRRQPPCCSAPPCSPTVHMSWAGLKWARPAERRLTASAGTSGAQFCQLSPRIWPCFSYLGLRSGKEREEEKGGEVKRLKG